MRNPSRIIRPAIILIAALLIYYRWSMTNAKEIIPWRQNYKSAAAESQRTGKPLFLYFTATWCGPCQSLKHTTWADPAVAAALAGFIPTKLDVDDSDNVPLARKYGAAEQGIPFFVVFDPQGRPVRRQVGTLNSALFIHWLDGQAPQYDIPLPSTQPFLPEMHAGPS